MSHVGGDVGVNLGRDSDLRLGATIGRLDASAKIGDPGLPTVAGKETRGHLTWRVDTQDSATVPSRGTLAHATFSYVFDGPNVIVDDAAFTTTRSSVGLPQLAGEANRFWRKGERTRLFVLGAAGTSFDHQPLPVDQFPLGTPMHLGAYSVGEIRGDHYVIATAGLLRELGRMPDFLGGPIFAGALDRKRRCLRRLERRDAADPSEWRPDPRHPGGPGDPRGQRGFRRPLANVHRRRPVVPLSARLPGGQ